MTTTETIFEKQWLDRTLVLIPQRDLREFEFHEIQEEVLEVANDPSVTQVVVDLAFTNYMGSTALGMLTLLYRQVKSRGGRVAFCNLSAHEYEILSMAGLADFWPIYASRFQALEAVAARTRMGLR